MSSQTNGISTSTLPKQHKIRGTPTKDKGYAMDKKSSTLDRNKQYRGKDDFDTTYRSGYELDRYRDSPVGGYNRVIV